MRGAVITTFFAVLVLVAVVFVVFRPGSGGSSDTTGAPVGSALPSASGLQAPDVGSSAGASQPSGPASGPATSIKMPVGNLPGWRQTFHEDFTGKFDKNWYVYDGQPGGDPGGWFSQDHVSQTDGMLVISGSKENTPNGRLYATGGVGSTFSQTYGRFMVRFRADAGFGVAYTLQLWPNDDSWPPEVDFAEDNGRGRTMTSATQHYGSADTHVHAETHGDFSQWHVAEVVWQPGKLTYLIDGKKWATMANSHVPTVPMRLALQTQAWPCGRSWESCPNSTTPETVKFYVDWVVAYAAD
jgi:Glycosyl hydrolases family 16